MTYQVYEVMRNHLDIQFQYPLNYDRKNDTWMYKGELIEERSIREVLQDAWSTLSSLNSKEPRDLSAVLGMGKTVYIDWHIQRMKSEFVYNAFYFGKSVLIPKLHSRVRVIEVYEKWLEYQGNIVEKPKNYQHLWTSHRSDVQVFYKQVRLCGYHVTKRTFGHHGTLVALENAAFRVK